MLVEIKIHDPNYPDDESRAQHLSTAQFAVVKDYIAGCVNARQGRGQPINERRVLRLLEQAGLPLVFNAS